MASATLIRAVRSVGIHPLNCGVLNGVINRAWHSPEDLEMLLCCKAEGCVVRQTGVGCPSHYHVELPEPCKLASVACAQADAKLKEAEFMEVDVDACAGRRKRRG
eukprot:6195647-Pleurochrysis_carterae.AAC.6